jgi:heterodisulfide reductase subunit A
VPDSEIYSLYIDIRAVGKNYEDFIKRAQEEAGVHYIRGKVSSIFEEDGKVKIFGVNSLLGKRVELEVDMAVLSLALTPPKSIRDLANKLRIAIDEYGFLQESHPKMHPLESATSGIFLAGCAQTIMDIQNTVAQASGAASKALGILTQEKISHQPTVAVVDRDNCSGCRLCISACPYKAISLVDDKAEVVELMCEGCGSCIAVCPSQAMTLKNLTDFQIQAMLNAVTEEV